MQSKQMELKLNVSENERGDRKEKSFKKNSKPCGFPLNAIKKLMLWQLIGRLPMKQIEQIYNGNQI